MRKNTVKFSPLARLEFSKKGWMDWMNWMDWMLWMLWILYYYCLFSCCFCRETPARSAWKPPSRRSRLHYPQSMSCFYIESSVSHRPGGEAFSFFRVFSGLMTNIRVHSCPFVVRIKESAKSSTGSSEPLPTDGRRRYHILH